ncbi:DNA replication complex GINS protein psf2 [Limtongia smithiae]|uniref:DNA replication complex GINS protein psf2 n=1 Tax=Limtongia smithiae TaxID=1125753 RepID=UPI0034CF9147
MALPPKQVGTFTPSEIAFVAEYTNVTIIPRQSTEAVDLIGGRIPPLRPMRRATVPLWVAIILKKQSRCNVVAPDWLSEESLKAAYEAEASNMERFSAMLPWEWLEVGEIILSNAPDDLLNPPHVIRNLLRDIREIRQAKVRAGIKNIDETYMQLDNIGYMELNEIRPFVTTTMNQLRLLNGTREDQEMPMEDEVQDADPEQYDDDDDDDMDMYVQR